MSWHYWQAIILGAVQGIAEFIPISSSGHLIIARYFLKLDDLGNLFDAILHLATLVVLVIYFRKDLSKLLWGWRSQTTRSGSNDKNILPLLLLATIPALIIGWELHNWLQHSWRSITAIAIFMIITGSLMIIAEKFFQAKHELKHLNWPKALGIGLAQALAILPGISRSGATMITGMYMGLKREVATRFSFLLAMPVIAAAGGYSLYLTIEEKVFTTDWLFLAVAFVTAVIFSWLAIAGIMRWVKNHSLNIFAGYLIIAGLVLVAINWI